MGWKYWTLTASRSATIYAYDVIMRHNAPFLGTKRVFAVPISGTPQSIKCDQKGYVYVGCADGIEVFNPGGMLHAVIEIPGESIFLPTFLLRLCMCVSQAES